MNFAENRFATDDWSHSQKKLTAAGARSMLENWQSAGAKLGFSYLRSGGGVIQTGTASVHRVTSYGLTLDTGESRIAVSMKDARFEFGNLGLLTPDFQAFYDIEGLSIILANHDCLCLAADIDEGALKSLARKLSLVQRIR